jgi:hypothetical protein
MTRVLNRLNIPEDSLEAKQARKNKRRSAPPIAFQAELSSIAIEDDSPASTLTPSRSHEDLKEKIASLETDI